MFSSQVSLGVHLIGFEIDRLLLMSIVFCQMMKQTLCVPSISELVFGYAMHRDNI